MLRKSINTLSRLFRKTRLRGLGRTIAYSGGRPLVVGFLSAPSGIGTGTRLLLDALFDLGLSPAAVDMTARFQPDLDTVDWRRGREFPADDGEGPVIVHANAPEAPFVLSEVGRGALQGRRRIGYWAWEFERIPNDWERELTWFHEIWAPSQFTAVAIASVYDATPVRAVGYALTTAVPDPAAISERRDSFGAAPGKLVFFAFDMRSSMDRKNPLDAIAIFKRATLSHRDARLVLKVNGWGWAPDNEKRLIAAIDGDERIQVMTETLNDADMHALMAACDVYLSPHRCEGFGLMLAAALMAGKPVIMTGWSGNLDFAHLPGTHPIGYDLVDVNDVSGVYEDSVGRWAAPHIEDAAQVLQALIDGSQSSDPLIIQSAAADFFSARNWFARTGLSDQPAG